MDGVAVVDCLKDVGGMGRALVVGDLAEVRENIGDRLSSVGFTIAYAEDGLDAYDVFVRDGSDLIVTDGQMPRLNGLGLVRRVREISNVPVVMLAEYGSIPDCEEAMRVGVDRYLQLRRDLDRVGGIACALVRESAAGEGGCMRVLPASITGGVTAAGARALARQELGEELQKQLRECQGNMAEMARRMGKDRSTIRYHLRRLGMLDSKADELVRLRDVNPRGSLGPGGQDGVGD
jgi:DNA-binding NtrC family response regulator